MSFLQILYQSVCILLFFYECLSALLLEQSAEEDIWTQERGNYKRLERHNSELYLMLLGR